MKEITYTLLQVNSQWIIVSDEHVGIDDWFITFEGTGELCTLLGIRKCEIDSTICEDLFKKIIAGIPEFPQIDFNGLEQQLGIFDVQKLADEYIKQYLPHVDTTGHWIGFQDGFQKALDMNKDKRFTLDDTNKFGELLLNKVNKELKSNYGEIDIPFTDIIQSLTKKEFKVKLDMYPSPITVGHNEIGEEGKDWEWQPTITSNSVKILSIKKIL